MWLAVVTFGVVVLTFGVVVLTFGLVVVTFGLVVVTFEVGGGDIWVGGVIPVHRARL